MIRRALACLAAFLLPLHPVAAAEESRGRELAASCVACHGESGNSRTENIPSLAGHPSPYLTIQLILFREQQRRNEVMTPLAKTLTDENIESLAAYFSAQKRVSTDPAANPELTALGQEAAGAHRCGTCHLPDYSGREQIPRLSAQRQDYLVKTMRDYKAGLRSGLDGMMTGVLHPVTDEQIVALAAYLSRLP